MIDTGMILSGRYKVECLIGTGGMAEVYRAQCLQTGRTVALKVLKEQFKDNAEFLRRFEREAQAVLTLSHENIVRSYDVGEDRGYHYIVLEYVEGCTLKAMIRDQGAMNPRQVVAIAGQLLDALGHAHHYGIIHRDIKPQNVIVTPKGKAKLADFGIARDADSSTVTFAGTNVLGSVHYISPEQAKGEVVTVESDLYSLGISIYEMLTGSVPFGGDNSVSIALKHLQEPILPPVQIRRNIPSALSDVVVRATAKDPAMRYHSAAEMKRDLLRALREPHGKFVRISMARDAAQPKEKKRRSGGIFRIALTLVLSLGLFVMMFLLVRSLWDRDRASESDRVPKLTGKTLDEAEQIAQLRGYTIEVTQWLSDDTVADGTVLDQSPEANASVGKGTRISVSVSRGSLNAVVPQLVNLPLNDAADLLAENGLQLGVIEYEQSDEVPPGSICRQNPAEGAELMEGDSVDVWVSGSADQEIEMPTLTGTSIKDAIAAIQELGFKRILVRSEEPVNDALENTVIKQSPSGGMSSDIFATVELTISNIVPGEYAADIAFNVDIAENDSSVMVTCVKTPGVEWVLYEDTLQKGVQRTVSFQAMTNFGGEYETILYVNGEAVRRSTIAYEYRG
ncbi:MAG: PASTA domain-containing protein [Bacillota bacterium]